MQALFSGTMFTKPEGASEAPYARVCGKGLAFNSEIFAARDLFPPAAARTFLICSASVSANVSVEASATASSKLPRNGKLVYPAVQASEYITGQSYAGICRTLPGQVCSSSVRSPDSVNLALVLERDSTDLQNAEPAKEHRLYVRVEAEA